MSVYFANIVTSSLWFPNVVLTFFVENQMDKAQSQIRLVLELLLND